MSYEPHNYNRFILYWFVGVVWKIRKPKMVHCSRFVVLFKRLLSFFYCTKPQV
jgi:hypothetical protein